MRTVWLASYPKSGNTWMRLLLGALWQDGEAAAIEDLLLSDGIASDRQAFDHLTLLESGLLSFAEIDALRPPVHRDLARQHRAMADDGTIRRPLTHWIKTHDAYGMNSRGEPLLGGRSAADGAILIARDPRDVTPSLANHNGTSIDAAIAFMCDPRASFAARSDRQHSQLRQMLGTWSGFNASWLEQQDLPVLLVRYEDLQADPAREVRRVLAFAGVDATADRIAAAVEQTRFETIAATERRQGFREVSRRAASQSFFRRGQSGVWREELTDAQIRTLERDHGPMMSRLGYDTDLRPGVVER